MYTGNKMYQFERNQLVNVQTQANLSLFNEIIYIVFSLEYLFGKTKNKQKKSTRLTTQANLHSKLNSIKSITNFVR